MSDEAPELLFSYGTLQQEAVQLATWGRRLTGWPDALEGYRMGVMKITNPQVVATSGAAEHPVAQATGDPADRVPGAVFEVTREELVAADAYEAADYRRERVRLASGRDAWVYVPL